MPEPPRDGTRSPGYVVLQEVEDGVWRMVGEVYAADLRSEWRIALEW